MRNGLSYYFCHEFFINRILRSKFLKYTCIDSTSFYFLGDNNLLKMINRGSISNYDINILYINTNSSHIILSNRI